MFGVDAARLCCRMKCLSLCCSQFSWGLFLWLTNKNFNLIWVTLFMLFTGVWCASSNIIVSVSCWWQIGVDFICLTLYRSGQWCNRNVSGQNVLWSAVVTVMLWHTVNKIISFCLESELQIWMAYRANCCLITLHGCCFTLDCVNKAAGFICARSHVVKEACLKC